jgi:hypothetical protein
VRTFRVFSSFIIFLDFTIINCCALNTTLLKQMKKIVTLGFVSILSQKLERACIKVCIYNFFFEVVDVVPSIGK